MESLYCVKLNCSMWNKVKKDLKYPQCLDKCIIQFDNLK